MVSIPKYNREQLASSVVGTPGVDTSAANIFNSVADTADTFSKIAADAAAERKSRIDKAEALKLASDYEIESYKIFEQHTKENAAAPTESTKVLRERLETRMSEISQGITSPGVKDYFTSSAINTVEKNVFRGFDWEKTQEAANAQSNAMKTIENRADEANFAGRDGDFNKFAELMAGVPAITEVTKGILSAEKQREMESLAPKAIVTDYIYGALDANPALIAKQIKDGSLDYFVDAEGNTQRLLSPEDKKKYLDIAKERVVKLSDEAEANFLIETMAEQDRLAELASKKALTQADIESIPDKDAQAVFQKLYQKSNPMSDVQKSQIAQKLNTEFFEMTKRFVTDKQPIEDKVKLRHLLNFRNRVYENFDALSTDQQNQFIKKLLPAIDKQLSKKAHWFSSELGDYGKGFNEINAWVDKIPTGSRIGDVEVGEQTRNSLKNSVFTAYVEQYDSTKGSKNQFGKPRTYRDVLKQIQDQYLGSYESQFPVGSAHILPNGELGRVVGYDPDTNKPQFEVDR